MCRRFLTLVFIVWFMVSNCSLVRAGSIWAKRDKNMKAFYSDDVARQVGDILTIIIDEVTANDADAFVELGPAAWSAVVAPGREDERIRLELLC